MKILLIDDHPLFRTGISQVLSDLDIVSDIVESSSAAIAFQQISQAPDYDCIFLDLDMPGMDGLTFLAQLQHKHLPIPVIILSANEDLPMIDRVLKAGANGYLSKAAAGEEISAALSSLIEDGGPYVSHYLREPLRNFRAGLSSYIQLTHRQSQVLQHLVKGESNTTISKALNITESTVKGHLSALFTILNVENRVQCVAEARARDLIA